MSRKTKNDRRTLARGHAVDFKPFSSFFPDGKNKSPFLFKRKGLLFLPSKKMQPGFYIS
jgi:hypothetical protein